MWQNAKIVNSWSVWNAQMSFPSASQREMKVVLFSRQFFVSAKESSNAATVMEHPGCADDFCVRWKAEAARQALWSCG